LCAARLGGNYSLMSRPTSAKPTSDDDLREARLASLRAARASDEVLIEKIGLAGAIGVALALAAIVVSTLLK
jgi:hypothetical protein